MRKLLVLLGLVFVAILALARPPTVAATSNDYFVQTDQQNTQSISNPAAAIDFAAAIDEQTINVLGNAREVNGFAPGSSTAFGPGIRFEPRTPHQ